MSRLRFDDGEEFDTSGELRIERRYDGLYVVGRGWLIPVEDVEEAREELARLKGARALSATDRVFDALENPDQYKECDTCHGYGSSLEEDAPLCTECDGTGVIAKEEKTDG